MLPSGFSNYLTVYFLLLNGRLLMSEPLMMCNRTSYVAYSPSESGRIVSPVPRNSELPLTCELKITACARCRIQLNFDGLQRSWLTRCLSSYSTRSAACHLGCNYLLLYEPGYYDKTYEYITAEYMPLHHRSSGRELTINYCQSAYDEVWRNFSFTYDILEKELRTFSGHTQQVDGVPTVVDQFSNLGFPRGYSSSGDVFEYYIRNEDPNGHVRLTFEDWNLSPFSDIMMYEGKNNSAHRNPVLHVTGASKRPFVVSGGNDMTVEFRTGTNIQQNYIGFRASIYFVSSRDWIDKPAVVDEVYFSSFGGELLAQSKQCTLHKRMDYLWVITRSRFIDDKYSLLLQLKTTDFSVGDSLEIRRGNSSTGELVLWRHHSELNDTDGFYVHLRMTCSPGNGFAATFIWTRSSRVDGCRPDHEFFCANRQICIPLSLRCDNIDHCGDSSDEVSCSEFSPPPGRETTSVGRCSGYFRCRSGELICTHQRCDDIVDCEDMTDERSCHQHEEHYGSYVALGIIIPILLILMMVLLAVCGIVGYLVRTRRRRAALIQARLYRQHQAALHAAGHFDDTIPYGWEARLLDAGSLEEPPSYGASVQGGNMPSDGSGHVVRPPSYQSTGDPELSVKYSVIGQNDTDDQAPPPSYSSDRGRK